MTGLRTVALRAVDRPWGGLGLPALGLEAPLGRRIGEYWLEEPDFPLLVKIIDAREKLSIQVHPDDATARALGRERGKTEAWHVLAADPAAELWLGLDPAADAERFFATARRGEDPSPLLVRHAPAAGDTYFVPAGTLHAIGAGIALLEVQQPADVTFRVYDWNRKPARALHLDEARTSFRCDPRASRIADPPRATRADLVRCEHFAIERVIASGPIELPAAVAPELYFCRAGAGAAWCGGATLEIGKGAFFLVDVGLQPLCLRPGSGAPPLELIRVVPA